MGLDNTQRNAVPRKLLFDPSEEWMRIGKPAEPDLNVDGLGRASLLERVFKLIGRRKAT
ncbi:MAG: hypothetical protein HKN84_16210 [Gammaproteobacteria bacterium]|nr:hypothetical protein [Gammaproteobacteria bacterium]